MNKLIVLSSILLAYLFSTTATGDECDISGVWTHSAKPAKLFINLKKGEISVHSHELSPESVGLVVLKKIKLDSSASSWNAKMYSAAEDSFVDVKITPSNCNQLSVAYKGEEILRLLR